MDSSLLIQKQINRIGSDVYIVDKDWTSMSFRAVINHLWRKKSSNFESTPTEVGFSSNDYYLYIGPANHDITALSDDAIVHFGEHKLQFKKRDAVMIDNRVMYYTGVLKLVMEAEYDEY